MKNKLNVLVACEFSGVVRDKFKNLGHNAYSCDLQPSITPSDYHYQCDIFEVIDNYDWDLLIAHPPCTYLANSGVRWLYNKDKSLNQERFNLMQKASQFFIKLYDLNIPHMCIENPIMHKHAKEIIKIEKTQIIQPWMFGHTESKATCLWLKNLPPLQETNNVKEKMLKLPINQRNKIHYMSPSRERSNLRSITYNGIAIAMADQWSQYILNNR